MPEPDPPRGGIWLRRAGLAAALVIFLLPWPTPYDPNEQLDSVGGRSLPPLSHRFAVELDHGVWRLVEDVERTEEGLRIRRRGATEHLLEHQVRNLTATGVSTSRFFLMGSDKFGRDVFSRWIRGARISVTIGILSVALAMSIGVLVGAAAAVGGPWVDALLMRLVDGLLAFPWFFLIVTLGALFSTHTTVLILLIGSTTWMSIARITRAEVSSLEKRDFVLAARGLGVGTWHLFRYHLFPNILPTLLVAATLRVGNVILFEAALSFLGFGVQPPDPSWGTMIAEGRGELFSTWWVVAFPALSLTLTVLAINLLSDRLRDVLDPRTL